MRVSVQLFAIARQRADLDRLDIELPEQADVAALRLAIARACPPLEPLLPSLMVAIDNHYATDATTVPPGARVALIPPVSGGAPPHDTHRP